MQPRLNEGRIIKPDEKLKSVLPVAKVDMLKVSDFPRFAKRRFGFCQNFDTYIGWSRKNCAHKCTLLEEKGTPPFDVLALGIVLVRIVSFTISDISDTMWIEMASSSP